MSYSFDQLKERRAEARKRWWYRRGPDLLFGSFFVFMIYSLIIFVTAAILTSCDAPYLPWNRGSGLTPDVRVESETSGGDDLCFSEEVARGECGQEEEQGGGEGTRSPQHHQESSTGPTEMENEEGRGVDVTGGVGGPTTLGGPETEDWCEELRPDVEVWRSYLDPNFDWSSVHHIHPTRRESVLRNLRTLVDHWDRTCA